jgi:arginyl-tRNA synthetase
MFQDFKRQAVEAVTKVLKEKGIEEGVPLEEPLEELGDLSTPLCFELAPILKKSPSLIAEELAKEIKAEGLIREVKAKRGYINFYLDYEKMAVPLIKEIKRAGEDYGRGRGKGRVILEHTSANPDGPLHIGHARNGIIGDTLARIMGFAGYDVETQYYLNDMGKQLAVVVWGLRRFKLDKEKKKDHAIAEIYVRANEALEANPEYQQEVSEIIRAYESGEGGIKKEFEEAAKYCIDGILETLGRIGITHDTIVWESTFLRDSSVEKTLKRIARTRYAKKDEVLYLDLSDFGIKKELILTRKDGTSLYATRDIAYHLWKSGKGTVVDVLGADHKLLSNQLAKTMEILGERPPETVICEFITLPEGAMSTRRGVFISLDDLINESIERAYAEVEKRRPEARKELKKRIAESVGTGAVRFNIAKISPDKAMTFRWEEALDFERQGSPFIQYAHARACRILEKAGVVEEFEAPSLTENEKRLLKALSKFPGVVEEAAEERRPHLMAGYALELADSFHKFYMFDPVLKSEVKDFRLNLVLATKIVLKKTLELLGIEPLEEM